MSTRIIKGARVGLLEPLAVVRKTRVGKIWVCRCHGCGREDVERSEAQLRRETREDYNSACHDCVVRIKREQRVERLMVRWGGKRIGQVTPRAVVLPVSEHPKFRCECACGGQVDVREDKLARAELHKIDIGCRACRDKFGNPIAGEREVAA